MLNFRTHSLYSYEKAISKIKDIADTCKKQGEDYFCISDLGSLKSFVKAFTIAKDKEMQFVPGCEFMIKPEDEIWDVKINERIKFCKKEMTLKRTTNEMYEAYQKEIEELQNINAQEYHLITLIAKNQTGFENLMNIYNSEKIYQKGGDYLATNEDIFKYSEGLIAIFPGYDSEPTYYYEKENLIKCNEILDLYKSIFKDDLYFAIEAIWTERNKGKYIDIMTNFSHYVKDNGIKLVCTNDSRYTNKEDRADYRLYRQIIGSDRIFFDRDDNYLINENELRIKMKYIYPIDYIDEGFDNIEEIKNKLEEIHEPTAEPLKDMSEELIKLCEEGWNKLRKGTDREEESKERYEYELSVINGRNFSEYFIKVLTIVKTAKKLGILIGPARGSGAGSEVCYLIGISHVDPLQYGLFFERFLNPERHGFPDIDLDMATVPLDRDVEENRLVNARAKEIIQSMLNNLEDETFFNDKLISTPIGNFKPDETIQTMSHGKITALELYKLTESEEEIEI